MDAHYPASSIQVDLAMLANAHTKNIMKANGKSMYHPKTPITISEVEALLQESYDAIKGFEAL